jgi:Zn-finger nucleic acid-binding protein
VEHDTISRIFVREDATFSEETVRLAKTLIDGKDKFRLNNTSSKNVWVISCPKCRHTMHRQFFIYSYPVEIDRCPYCSGIWFDRQELELLQYLYEHKELYFEKGQF